MQAEWEMQGYTLNEMFKLSSYNAPGVILKNCIRITIIRIGAQCGGSESSLHWIKRLYLK